MFKRLLPRETSFFAFFERHTKLGLEACRELDAYAANPLELEAHAARIKDIEHKADAVTRECIGALHRTFITPIDRAEIHRLIQRLDDFVDSINSAASRMALYQLHDARPELKQFTQALLAAAIEIDAALGLIRSLAKNGPQIQQHCQAVWEIEKRADEVLRHALVHLFEDEKDPIMVLKWKEIFERLERAADRCDDVANIVSGIAVEAS